MCGTAAAASSRSTVMRTISEPARASAATCATVPATSAVSVLVIDCTTTGAPPPTCTPPTITGMEVRRGRGAERYPVILCFPVAPAALLASLLTSGAEAAHLEHAEARQERAFLRLGVDERAELLRRGFRRRAAIVADEEERRARRAVIAAVAGDVGVLRFDAVGEIVRRPENRARDRRRPAPAAPRPPPPAGR